MTQRLTAISILVKDVDASHRFYRDLVGLELDELGADAPGEVLHSHAIWGESGDNTFLLLTISDAANEEPSRVRLGFAVDDIDARHERLVDAGTTVTMEPQQQPWGKSASYLDPDGNSVTLTRY